jgi:hypothetical protein
MNYRSILTGGALTVCALFAAKAQDSDRSKAEQYIIESEKHWAVADASGDSAFVDSLLAPDFMGVSPQGEFYNKTEALQETRENKGKFVSNQVNGVKVRFYGDTAVAQGTETWERVSGKLKRGSYVCTDTWIKRNNKWEIVAAEDLTTTKAPSLPK